MWCSEVIRRDQKPWSACLSRSGLRPAGIWFRMISLMRRLFREIIYPVSRYRPRPATALHLPASEAGKPFPGATHIRPARASPPPDRDFGWSWPAHDLRKLDWSYGRDSLPLPYKWWISHGQHTVHITTMSKDCSKVWEVIGARDRARDLRRGENSVQRNRPDGRRRLSELYG